MANLLPILPHETIYSWVTRNYLLSGFATYKTYYKFLFGTERVRIHPFLNNRISLLSKASNMSNKRLVWSHSLFPLFVALNGNKFFDKTYHYLLVNKAIPTSVFGLNQHSLFGFHGHKYCPQCVEKNKSEFGFHYWHINHQLPGVSACAEHKTQLHGLTSDDFGLDRQLVLPIKDVECTKASDIDAKFATFVDCLFKLSQTSKNEFNLNELIIIGLKKRDLITIKGQFRKKEIIKQLKQYWQGLTPQSKNILSIPDSLLTFQYVTSTLRNLNEYICHPVKQLLVIGWLCNCNINNFFVLLTDSNDEDLFSNEQAIVDTDNLDEKILDLIKQGVSHNEIYRRTGRSRVYIKRIACKAGLYSYSSGIKINSASFRAILRKGLYGIHRYVIAKSLQISTGTVEQVMSTAPDIIRWRKRLKSQINKSEYRTALLNYILEHQDCRRKDIKSSCNAAFFWCYNNDKEWLESVLPTKQRPSVTKVNWFHRDTESLNRLKTIIKTIKTPVSVINLDKLIGGKKWLTRFIDKLPKTKRFLYKLIESKAVQARHPEKYK